MKAPLLSIDEMPGLLVKNYNGNLSNAILDQIEALICIFDTKLFKLEWANKYTCKRLGYTNKELITMNNEQFLSIFHPEFQHVLMESLKGVRDNYYTISQNLIKIKTKNNLWLWVLSTICPYENDPLDSQRYVLGYATEIDIHQLNKNLINSLNADNFYPHGEITKILSEREKIILKLIANGNTDKQISESLKISIHTAKTHRKRIIHKLCLKNSPTLIKFAIENGLG